MLPLLLFADPICMDHLTGPGHPESPARFQAVMDSLKHEGIVTHEQLRSPQAASVTQLGRAHTETYIKQVQVETEQGLTTLTTGDTEICPRSYEVATYAAGAMISSVDAIMCGETKRCLSVMRPPGHHASADRGMGFCVFNHVAVGARHAQEAHGLERVLIVDWDVHHGNGTQDIFYYDPSVYYFSCHQSPWYPGTGSRTETGGGPGAGTTLNVPLPAGSGRTELLDAFDHQLKPAMQQFCPNLIMISAGFDARRQDPLGSFTLDDQDFADLTTVLVEMADEYCEGRIVSTLEGGYNLQGLASAVAAHALALRGA